MVNKTLYGKIKRQNCREEGIKKGIVGSTAGTIELSLESMKGVGDTAGSGVGRSTAKLTGSDAVRAWEANIPTRYATAMQQARQALAEMPYPPVLTGAHP